MVWLCGIQMGCRSAPAPWPPIGRPSTSLLREAPVAVIGLALVFVVIWFVYRDRLPPTLPAMELEERFAVHHALMVKTIAAVSVMLVLSAVTAVLSNVVSNVPAVLLFKTLIPTFEEPTRAWLVLAMASTFAGNLTIMGSVANLIVVEQARGVGIRIGFGEYSRVGVPVTLLTLFVGWVLLIL